jgi:hypothetical protein
MEDFAVTCPLVPSVPHLRSGSCTSPCIFGLDFLQTPPRDDALVLLLSFGSASTWCRDLHPTSYVPCLAHTLRVTCRPGTCRKNPQASSGQVDPLVSQNRLIYPICPSSPATLLRVLFRLLILRIFDLLVMFLSNLFLALGLIFLATFVSHCSLLFSCMSFIRRVWRSWIVSFRFTYLHCLRMANISYSMVFVVLCPTTQILPNHTPNVEVFNNFR